MKKIHRASVAALILIVIAFTITACTRPVDEDPSIPETSSDEARPDRAGSRLARSGEKAPAVTDGPRRDDAAAGAVEYAGDYEIEVIGFKGTLRIEQAGDSYRGWVQFRSWGNEYREPLKNLKITGTGIQFTRSVLTAEEAEMTGASRYFSFSFHGTFQPDGTIRGYYLEGGTEMPWRAYRTVR